MPELAHDFPFGAPRFVQRAQEYKATLVNGDIILLDDELTKTALVAYYATASVSSVEQVVVCWESGMLWPGAQQKEGR